MSFEIVINDDVYEVVKLDRESEKELLELIPDSKISFMDIEDGSGDIIQIECVNGDVINYGDFIGYCAENDETIKIRKEEYMYYGSTV